MLDIHSSIDYTNTCSSFIASVLETATVSHEQVAQQHACKKFTAASELHATTDAVKK